MCNIGALIIGIGFGNPQNPKPYAPILHRVQGSGSGALGLLAAGHRVPLEVWGFGLISINTSRVFPTGSGVVQA